MSLSGEARKEGTWLAATLLLGALCLLLSASCLGSTVTGAPPSKLRTLTTARQAHSLPAIEAMRGYPIHFKAVVTYYDAYLDPRQKVLFVHDATGSMFVRVPRSSPGALAVGDLVDVRGVSGLGDYAPIIAQAQVTRIGQSHLPLSAQRVSLPRLLTGDFDGQWVQLEGVIHSVYQTEHDTEMQVATQDGIIPATLPREPGRDAGLLVDSRVIIEANAGPVFNGDGQMIGARLMVPNLSTVHVLEAGAADALALPVRSIGSLSRFSTGFRLPRRIHVRGRVTLAWPGALLCIRDETHGLCAHSAQIALPRVGEMADVAGFVEIGGSSPALSDAVFRPAGALTSPSLAPVVAEAVSAEQALNGRHDSELVKLDGQLIGRDLVASDTTLMLASKGFVYAVLLPRSMADGSAWKNGSRLRVTGICSVQLDSDRTAREGGAAIRKSFRVLLRSPQDVQVLQKPTWWTPAHTVPVLGAVLMVTLMVLGWVVVLTRRLKQQARAIGESEELFRHQAQHDALTGLPTRLLLRDRLDAALEKAKRTGTGLALLMLDLDNFKLINDSLGHHAGDQALKISALRITEAVRRSDTVARISGDEFVVLISELNEPHEAELVAAKIVAALSAPFRVGDRDVPLSASVGVCPASGSNLDADALLKSVDAAMYHAKARGRNCFQLYTADMARSAQESLQMRAQLGRALPAQELEVHYQPMVSFSTGELTGFEALVRWRSKEMGLIMPGDFIPVAEQTGLIIPIGEWVLRQACSEIGMLEQQLGRDFLLSVNLSPRQIEHQQELPQLIEDILGEFGRAPRMLEFEITESMLMSDSATNHAAILDLRKLGVRLAIDDFGMGFSSLSYITRFSIDRIKIDRSFIRKCTREGGNLAVVRAIVAMAHGMGMDVVAEGVETVAEFRFLREEGCDTAQGYYLSRPVPAAELAPVVQMMRELADIQSAGVIESGRVEVNS